MDENKFCQRISNIAIKSILYELAATPKPGLVDRVNSGAHSDMDYFTFLNSSSVLAPYFYKCTWLGIDFRGREYRDLLSQLRPLGIEAERDMFRATRGVNTHKGVIFSAGIVAGAAGSIYSQRKDLNIESLISRVKEITRGISDELEASYKKKDKSYGESLFIKYGIKGIRGEAESGFKTVMEHSYPVFKELIESKKYPINQILVQTLLYLIKATEDTNILGRHDMETLRYSQARAREALEKGGSFSQKGREFLEDLDRDFIEKRISPGGSADLLALTLMLYMIGNSDII